MIGHRHIDAICVAAAVLAAAATILLIFIALSSADAPEYALRLFDDSRVHFIDIRIPDWKGFIADAEQEEYVLCDLEIDGEMFYDVGIRAKGNNSLRLTSEYGLSRYSLKLEFDCFAQGGNYYGLDKFSLDASFQDNSYMKTYIAYDMMEFMGVPAPLCSYVWVSVNGSAWGLYLAVEEPEEAFAKRNFGKDYGKLYKPDYRSLSDENADIALKYIDDDPNSYPGIFDNAKFDTTKADQKRVTDALKVLASGENLETAVNVDEVLRYFSVQVFVMNWDSYIGYTGHNYFLYEEDGIISILPWDYNLAFGTYALGMSNPIKDPDVIINYPINTPAEGDVMLNRPLYHNLMKNDEYFKKYHEYLDALVEGYFESGRFKETVSRVQSMTAPYVKTDPTAFCSYNDYLIAVNTLEDICMLRAQSVRGQLEGKYPATIRSRQENPGVGVDASGVDIHDLGDFDDLERAKAKNDEALNSIP